MCLFYKTNKPISQSLKCSQICNISEAKYNMFLNGGISRSQLIFLSKQNINLNTLSVLDVKHNYLK